MASCDFAVVSHFLLYVGGGILADRLDAAVATAFCSRREVAGADAAKAGPAKHPTRAVSSTAARTGRRRQDDLSSCSMVPSYLTMSSNGARLVPKAPSSFRSASISPPPCSPTAALPISAEITNPPRIRADTYKREIRTLPQGWGPSHSPSTYITRHVAGPLADPGSAACLRDERPAPPELCCHRDCRCRRPAHLAGAFRSCHDLRDAKGLGLSS